MSPSAGPAPGPPLLVLIVRDPWLMVVGADSPAFALYADGLVIRSQPGGPESSPFVQARLGVGEVERFLREARLDDLWGLEEHYQLSDRRDEPAYQLHAWRNGERKSVRVYGPLREEGAERAAETRAKAPGAFVRVLDHALALAPAEWAEWVAPMIEVLVWPYDHSPEEPVSWPANWPPIAQDACRDDPLRAHRILVPGAELPRLRELLRGLQPRQAVLAAGRKWAISYRFPFPRE
jgi:hypothetical protein